MLGSRIASIASKASLSVTFIASTAYISYRGDLTSRKFQASCCDIIDSSADTNTVWKKTSLNLRQEADLDDQFFFIHDDDQRFLATADHVLKEARHEIRESLNDLSSSSSIVRNAKVRAIVIERFLDIMTRSARALADFKLHSTLHHEDEESLSVLHARTAKSMHDACAVHGGILVKLGQYVAANAGGFLPKEYVEALSPLQDSCSPLSFQQIEELINEQLRDCCRYEAIDGEPIWKRVFREIEPSPLGSASLAQVHAATLHDGRRVAIKVQRPNLDVITQADIVALSVLSRAIELSFPGTGFDWILPEFYKTVTAELDFTQEAANAERSERLLRGCCLTTDTSLVTFLATQARELFHLRPISPPTVIIPKPIRELTTAKMLTMTYEEGFKITALNMLEAHGIDKKKVAAASCALFAELMFVHGFCYADCHPGNVLVRPRCHPAHGEFDLVLLDHGMYRRLDEQFRAGYCNLWAGLVSGNDSQALRGLRTLGLQDKYLDIMGLLLTYRIPLGVLSENCWVGRNKLGTTVGRETQARVKQYLQNTFGEGEVSAAGLNKFIESQPRDLLFCLRCTNLVRSTNRELGGTTVDRFLTFGTAAARGANLSCSETSPEPCQDIATDILKTPMSDVLAQVKASLNKPIASELRALKRAEQKGIPAAVPNAEAILPRTLFRCIETYKLSLRTWLRGLLLDIFIFLSGTATDLNPRNLG